eukprot:4400244-Alexandrium_andersonii.AAC.1
MFVSRRPPAGGAANCSCPRTGPAPQPLQRLEGLGSALLQGVPEEVAGSGDISSSAPPAQMAPAAPRR